MDDRKEYFEATPEQRIRAATSVVALIPRAAIHPSDPSFAAGALSLSAAQGLCPGEPFADQPAAAFCSGVLVDWDLVLTAGHCLRLLALSDFVVAFGFYYVAPGQLAVQSSDLRDPVDIVSERLDPPASEPRLDYAWVRLDRPVESPREPAPIHVRQPRVLPGDSLLSIATPGGVPLKIDSDAKVGDPRTSLADYFVADTDTSAGASGAGAFDSQGAVLGVLARGGTDYVPTDAGCLTTNDLLDGGPGAEQYTYTHQAVMALCRSDALASTLCRTECGDPCQALPKPAVSAGVGGCAVQSGYALDARGYPGVVFVLFPLVLRRMRRPWFGRSRRPEPLTGRRAADRK